jgi:hypothetical protein
LIPTKKNKIPINIKELPFDSEGGASKSPLRRGKPHPELVAAEPALTVRLADVGLLTDEAYLAAVLSEAESAATVSVARELAGGCAALSDFLRSGAGLWPRPGP